MSEVIVGVVIPLIIVFILLLFGSKGYLQRRGNKDMILIKFRDGLVCKKRLRN